MDKITRFERARLIGARALQISFGAPALIKPKKEMTPLEVAREEIEKKVIPFVVLRSHPSGEIRQIDIY